MANQGQLLSAISGYEETEFDTLIPQINSTADVIEAFKQYHYGLSDFNGTVNPSPNSIHSHLSGINDRVTTLESTPTGGGLVQENIPHLVIRTDLTTAEVPEGFMWVDEDGSVANVVSAGVVTLTNDEPALPTHGQVWVDKDYNIASVNLSNYATLDSLTQLQNTVTQLTARVNAIEGLALVGL